jgi:glycogen(starch) synthase
MRVLFLTPLYIPWVGGLEEFVRQLSRALGSRGHEIRLITSHVGEEPSGLDRVDDVTVLRVNAHELVRDNDAAGILRAQVEIANFARGFEPDVVHSHDAGPVLWLYHRLARRNRRPLVITLHNVMSIAAPESSLPVMAKLFREADWVTGVSAAVTEDVLTYAPDIGSRLSVIRNGIVPDVEATPIPGGPPRFVCIGRLVEQKGFDLAISAFAAVRERHPSARLTIAGDGPERPRLVALASDLDVADSVDFLGMVDRVRIAKLLEEATVVVMPSRYEGLPLVALEAAWAARPVVAAQWPGLGEAVRHGETGVVVPADDVAALVAGMAELADDSSRAGVLGRQAREMAEELYTMERCADAYEQLYQRVVGTPVW